jgi:hypothetical protein
VVVEEALQVDPQEAEDRLRGDKVRPEVLADKAQVEAVVAVTQEGTPHKVLT